MQELDILKGRTKASPPVRQLLCSGRTRSADVTASLCGSMQTHFRTQMPSQAVTSSVDRNYQERTLEAEEFREEAVVQKEARVVEEIRMRKTSDTYTETISDTLRRNEVEHDRNDLTRGDRDHDDIDRNKMRLTLLAQSKHPLVLLVKDKGCHFGPAEGEHIEFVVASPDGYLLRFFQDLGTRSCGA